MDNMKKISINIVNLLLNHVTYSEGGNLKALDTIKTSLQMATLCWFLQINIQALEFFNKYIIL